MRRRKTTQTYLSFPASDFDYIRVECCDGLQDLYQSVDSQKNGRAEPLVDELASAPLDLGHANTATPNAKQLAGMLALHSQRCRDRFDYHFVLQ